MNITDKISNYLNEGLESHVDAVLEDKMDRGGDYWWDNGMCFDNDDKGFKAAKILNATGDFNCAYNKDKRKMVFLPVQHLFRKNESVVSEGSFEDVKNGSWSGETLVWAKEVPNRSARVVIFGYYYDLSHESRPRVNAYINLTAYPKNQGTNTIMLNAKHDFKSVEEAISWLNSMK